MIDSAVTLVTGGASGIGAATARALLARGERVAVLGRSGERLAAFAGEVDRPEGLLTRAGDAADFGAVRGAVEASVARFGRLDAVVASAAFASVGNLEQGDPAQWREMVLTNVLGPAVLIKAALPALRASRGRIVLVGSTVGLTPSRGNLYGATKWAVTGLAENARQQVTGDGIGVTLIAPGRVETPFWDVHGGVPEGDNLTAAQVADAIVWALGQPDGVDVNTVVVRPIGAER
ncbi:MAG TPA: SDR family NAD(P)-dependent oxidoreductase [Pseudonocardiaceae bacterium]|nr:SDR family NAD(P)-dependent oxidoreductase [Pseudonocardiaceae bacterium]